MKIEVDPWVLAVLKSLRNRLEADPAMGMGRLDITMPDGTDAKSVSDVAAILGMDTSTAALAVMQAGNAPADLVTEAKDIYTGAASHSVPVGIGTVIHRAQVVQRGRRYYSEDELHRRRLKRKRKKKRTRTEGKGERRVRTPAGVRRYKQPIGSIIVSDAFPRVDVNIWPEGGDRETISVIDYNAVTDYLESTFSDTMTREWDDGNQRHTYNPVVHGKKPKQESGVYHEEAPMFAVIEPNPDPRFAMMTGFYGNTEPITYVYRGMTKEEWDQAQERGYILSDRRGTIIEDWEGTNAGVDLGTARSYLPRNGEAVIVKIAIDPIDEWFVSDADNYVRTRRQVPLSRVMTHTGVITLREGHVTDIAGAKGTKTLGDVMAVVEAFPAKQTQPPLVPPVRSTLIEPADSADTDGVGSRDRSYEQ